MKPLHLRLSLWPVWGLFLLSAPVVAADTLAANVGTVPAIPYARIPQTAVAPVIDGRLDDVCWQQATRVTDFHPALVPATLVEADLSTAGEARDTEVLLTWRPEALLVAFRCRDSHVITSPGRTRDDQLYTEDVVEVFFDPIGDGRRYWEVQLSPRGQVTDALHVITAEPPPTPTGRLPVEFYVRQHLGLLTEDLPGLIVAASTTTDGWSAEIAIPVAALPRAVVGTVAGSGVFAPGWMRLNLVRYDWTTPRDDTERKLHQASWSSVEHGCPHQSAGRMGWIQLVAP